MSELQSRDIRDCNEAGPSKSLNEQQRCRAGDEQQRKILTGSGEKGGNHFIYFILFIFNLCNILIYHWFVQLNRAGPGLVVVTDEEKNWARSRRSSGLLTGTA